MYMWAQEENIFRLYIKMWVVYTWENDQNQNIVDKKHSVLSYLMTTSVNKHIDNQ